MSNSVAIRRLMECYLLRETSNLGNQGLGNQLSQSLFFCHLTAANSPRLAVYHFGKRKNSEVVKVYWAFLQRDRGLKNPAWHFTHTRVVTLKGVRRKSLRRTSLVYRDGTESCAFFFSSKCVCPVGGKVKHPHAWSRLTRGIPAIRQEGQAARWFGCVWALPKPPMVCWNSWGLRSEWVLFPPALFTCSTFFLYQTGWSNHDHGRSVVKIDL